MNDATVRCNSCMSVFYEHEIIIQNDAEHCPWCGQTGALADLEAAQ